MGDEDSPEPHTETEEFSGMAKVYPALQEAVLPRNRNWKRKKGWAALAVVQGIHSVFEDLKSTLDITSLICGLILSASIPLMVDPPRAVDAADNSNLWKQAYGVFMTGAIAGHFSTILLNLLLINAFNTAARKSDRYRLLIALEKWPSYAYTMFCLGNVMVCIALAIAVYFTYGTVAMASFCFVVLAGCGFASLALNEFYFLRLAHVNYGWRDSTQEEIMSALLPIKELAEKDIKKNIQLGCEVRVQSTSDQGFSESMKT